MANCTYTFAGGTTIKGIPALKAFLLEGGLDTYLPERAMEMQGPSASAREQVESLGINVNQDGENQYADKIVDGQKTLETRASDSLRPYVGKRVAIVRTGDGPAKAIGAVTIGEPIRVSTQKQFDQYRDQTLVPKDSKFDIAPGGVKYLYPVKNPVRYATELDVGLGIVARKVIAPSLSRREQKNAAASRVEGTSADRFKRTPALQQAVVDLQEGKITRDEYNRMVDEMRPVYPYKDLPAVTTPKDARYALENGRGQSPEKAAKYGVPSMTLTKGDFAQLRLDIPSYQEHNAWVVSVHTPKSTNREVQAAYDAGPVVGYESVAALTDVTFGMNQKAAAKIATGSAKGTIATMLGKWSPISKEAAKARAEAAMKDPAWTQVGMDPFRHSYFYDRDTMRPVLSAGEVIQIGPLVLAKNAQFSNDDTDITGAQIAFSATQADQSKIINPVDPNATAQEKVQTLVRLTRENRPIVKKLMAEIDAAMGTKSSDNVKAPEKILQKASRPAILFEKPWHDVEHIRDSYRFKTILDSITQLPEIIKRLEDSGIEIIKRDTRKVLSPGEWGWRIAAFDLRMPNGQLVEYYLPVKELETAKKEKGHYLFEQGRNLDPNKITDEEAKKAESLRQESRDLYQGVWDAYLARTGDSLTDIRASLSKVAASAGEAVSYPSADRSRTLSPEGAGVIQLPSGLRPAEKSPSKTKTPPAEPIQADNIKASKRSQDDTTAYSNRQGLDRYIGERNKSLDLVSSQSIQNQDIETAVAAFEAVLSELENGNKDVLPVPIGRTPHVLSMLRQPTQMLKIDTSIIKKVFLGKHAEEFGNITPRQLILAIYQPAMVLKSKTAGEYEIVTSVITPKGPVIVPIQVDSRTLGGVKSSSVKSIYGKKVSLGGDSILQRLKDGALVYADPTQAQVAVTGKGSVTPIGVNTREAQFSDARPIEVQDASIADFVKPLNPYFVGWSQARNIILDGISSKKVKSDVDLMAWIGNNYKGETDAPSFSPRQFPSAQGQRFTLQDETYTKTAQRNLQDYFVRVKDVQDVLAAQGGTVGEAQNVYLAEELSYGRLQEQMVDFKEDMLKPLIKATTSAGLELSDLALYAYAKHAPERNMAIAARNKTFGKGEGSGMTTSEANNIMRAFKAEGKDVALDKLHDRLMQITQATRLVMLDDGLITQDQFDALQSAYANYVPLRGFVEDEDPESGRPVSGPRVGGRGFNIRGKETMRALGRESRAGHVIENIVIDYERAVARAERNTVAKVFLDLVTTNPDPGLWEIDATRTKAAFDRATGKVQYNTLIDKGEDTVSVKVDGNEIYIKIKDPLLLRAMRNAGKDETGAIDRILGMSLGKYTALMRNTLTRYNPAFGFTNAVKDLGFGAVSALADLGPKGTALYLKNYANPVQSGPMFDEFRAAGATTGGWHMRDQQEMQKELQRLVEWQGGSSVKSSAYSMARTTLDALEFVGQYSETQARFAAYKAARQMKKSPAEAASIAKNLTTNFNRKGEWGSAINTMYLFFNAGVQGSAKTLKNLRSPYVIAAMTGLSGLAAGLAFMGAGVGGDDDDGEAYWDKIPQFEKERNLIIMLPPGEGLIVKGESKVGKNGRYLKLPIQYGINTFSTLGYQIADLARYSQNHSRGVSPAKAANNMVSVTFGSFNPFGGGFNPTKPVEVALAVSPSIVDLGVQALMGVNSFGTPVAPRKYEDYKPDAENFGPGMAGSWEQRLARWLSESTGGDRAVGGAIDVSPGSIRNIVRNLTGGTGDFLTSVFVNIPSKMWSPEGQIGPRDVPVLKAFYGEADEVTASRQFYERKAEVMEAGKQAADRQKMGIDVKYDAESLGLQSLGNAAKEYTKKMTELRKEELKVAEDSSMTDAQKTAQRKTIQKDRAQIASEFNGLYYSMKKDLAKQK